MPKNKVISLKVVIRSSEGRGSNPECGILPPRPYFIRLLSLFSLIDCWKGAGRRHCEELKLQTITEKETISQVFTKFYILCIHSV